MSRVPDHPQKPVHARLEATTLGLALVVDTPIRNKSARRLLDDINRQVDELDAQGRKGQTK
ncbi:hypothetical protein ACI3KW_02335 [Devosia sp. ZW T5_3]|uniref:hypothetical protein n=1 Tax=Devosia sp. ZW T5_3 TaxID=3378085 RepID=UPI003851B6B9